MFLRFGERIGTPRWWTLLAFRTPRGGIAFGLAVAPALALLLAAWLWPPMTEPERVRDTFARYISGLITAATIAVAFATLSLRRGIKGIVELKEHVAADRKYADRVAELTGKQPPIGIGETLAILLDSVAARAREVREPELAAHAEDVATRVRAAGGNPDRLLIAALELDVERAMQEARSRIRDERLADLLEAADIGRSYVKTLATQWGIGRMSQAIALSSMVAVVVATAVVLAYEPSALAPIVLAVALLAVLMPLAVFVSYALRLTFVNQHTLPIGHFVLGPENPRVVRRAGRASHR